MEVFHQEIQELINHCQKIDIDFNLVYKNTLLVLNSQENASKLNQRKSIKEFLKLLLKSWIFWITLTVIALLLLIYLQLELITNHAVAIGRIMMIQVLPFYDWRPLKRERCLVKRSALFSEDLGKMDNPASDCNYCDGINSVAKLRYMIKEEREDPGDATQEDLVAKLAKELKSYYDIDAPVIVTNTSEILYNYQDVSNDQDYNEYVPCNVESNVYIRKSAMVMDIFDKLDKAPFYFAHWRNCNLHAMKLFRRFFPRPDYLHVNFAPIQQSWLILSKNYNSENQKHKQLKLTERLAVVGVVQGHLRARLTPIRYCFIERFCNDITVDLYPGDALIISDQWDIDYFLVSTDDVDVAKVFPEADDVNIAFVLETH